MVNQDSESLFNAVLLFHQMWAIPLQIVVTLWLLSRILGISVWAGVGALGLALLLLILVVPLFMRNSAPEIMKANDERLKKLREVLQGMLFFLMFFCFSPVVIDADELTRHFPIFVFFSQWKK